MRGHSEHDIQKACVTWFRLSYSRIEGLFFAVPNGGKRDAVTARLMREEGVRAGVADLVLLVPRHGYGALCVEMKTLSGHQSEEQKKFERLCAEVGVKYVVCRSFDEFREVVEKYMED